MTDALWIAWWFACALWARRYFPTFVSLIVDRAKPEVLVPEVVKTVRDMGWGRWPSGSMSKHARWQVGA